MGVRLDQDETWAFLAASHTGMLSTIRADGAPSVIPMWFVTIERAVYIRTLAGSPKAANVRRDPRVCFLVESGKAWAELKAVVLHGEAAITEDPDICAQVDALFDAKYAGFRTPDAVPDATKRHYAAPRAHIRIVERGRPLTWDNARLRSTP
ncbi:MAG: pyridoxamine 5'-phosphate oxidase family protein [Solirubrobacteraceae bacterium]